MRKQIFNTFKLPQFTRNFRFTSQWFKQNPKTTLSLTAAMLFASSATLVGHTLQNTVKNTDQASSSDQEEIYKAMQIEFVPLTEEKYKEAIANKYDVVIFANSEQWKDEIVDQVKGLLASLQSYQTEMKGRKLKFFDVNIKNKKELQEFRETYKADINRETFLLLKNRYNEELKEFTLNDWFDNQRSIYVYFKNLQRVRSNNFNKFAAALPHFDSEGRVLFAYIPKSSPNYKQLKKEFAKLAIYFASEGKDINSFLITDPEVAEKIGADPKKGEKIYIMNKSSKYDGYKKNVNLAGNNANVLELPVQLGSNMEKMKKDLGEFYKENYVFMKSEFDDLNTDYTLVFQVNENRIKKNELNQVLETLIETHKELKTNQRDLFKDLKIVKFKRNMPNQAYTIYVQDNKSKSEDLYLKYYNKKPLPEEKKIQLLQNHSKSFDYEFPKDQLLTKENLINFIADVKAGKVKPYFPGKPVPNAQKYSTKVVQDSFKRDILDVDKHHVLFLCTKNCSGCKFMGKFYEQFALENLRKPDSDIQFNRINTEKNTIRYLPNYPYTPVFLILKKEDRTKPYLYKPQTGHPDALKEWIEITTSQNWIDRNVEEKLFKAREKSKHLFNNVKFEETK